MRNWKTLLKPSSIWKKEKHDRQQEVASASMGDKTRVFFCWKLSQPRQIRFYTGIVNWNVFLQLFNFIEDLPSLLKLQVLDFAIEEFRDDLNHQEEQMEYLENQSRRNNVRIYGIPEEDNETWEKTEAKVREVLKDELNLASAPDVERAHRVGRSSRRPASAQSSANRPWTIVCRLRYWRERETILKSARRIKPDNIFVKEDLSPVTLEKTESQRPKLEAAKRAGKIAYFVLDKLVIRDRPNVENS